MTTAAERGGNLTRQLMLFGGRQAMDLRELDLNEAITEIVPLLKKLLGAGIQIDLFPYSHPLPCRADRKMMQQVVLAIANNAKEAIGTKGTFTVKLEAKADNGSAPSARLILKDTGCGIDQEALDRIFEPFFTTRKVGRGSGLGLCAAYGIIKKHEGEIKVSSQSGKGTTFEITLPLLRNTAPESLLPLSLGEGRARREADIRSISDDQEKPGPTILLVEDEDELRSLVQVLLEGFGYRVLVAENGVTALQIWTERQVTIDLVLTDMAMPEGMTGWQLAAKLKSEQPDLKVVYTSGYSVDMIGDASEELIEGENFVQKPYRPQTLADTLKRALSKRESLTC
jgi:CheY-like chemotaxis protein